jgi:hypothetical protein
MVSEQLAHFVLNVLRPLCLQFCVCLMLGKRCPVAVCGRGGVLFCVVGQQQAQSLVMVIQQLATT